MKFNFYQCLVFIAYFAALATNVKASSDVSSYISLSQMYEDNLFRLNATNKESAGEDASDQIRKLGAGLDYGLTFSRQSLNVGVAVIQSEYYRNEHLNNFSANVDTAFNWELGKKLSGKFGYDYKYGISDFSDYNGTVKNGVTTQNVSFNSGWRIEKQLLMAVELSEKEVFNTVESLKFQDRGEFHSLISLSYLLRSGGSIGLSVDQVQGRSLSGKTDGSVNLSYYFDQYSTNIFSQLELFDKTLLDVSFGAVCRQYKYTTASYDGNDIALSLVWKPTPLTSFTLKGYQNISSSSNSLASFSVNRGAELLVSTSIKQNWALKLSAKTERRDSDLAIVQSSGVSKLEEDYLIFNSGIGYSPNSYLNFDFSYQLSRRVANLEYYNYEAGMWSASINLNL